VDQLGRLLLHGAGVVKDPLGLFLVGRRGQIYSNALIERILHTKDLFEFVHGNGAWEPLSRVASPAPGKNNVALRGRAGDFDALLPLSAPSEIAGLSTNPELRLASQSAPPP